MNAFLHGRTFYKVWHLYVGKKTAPIFLGLAWQSDKDEVQND